MSTTPAGADPVPETPDEPEATTSTRRTETTGTRPAGGPPADPTSSDPTSTGGATAAAGETSPAVTERRGRLGPWALVLAALVLAVDQLTKWWALSALTEGERVPLLGDLLGLSLVFNPGAALSFMADGYTWILTIVVVAVIVVILRAVRRLGSVGWAVALGLLLGGALGNLVDRLLREPGFARGEVVDMIAYADFFVGNVADIAIVVAAGLIVVLSFRGIRIDGTRESAEAA
ncbi:signal peptidase II [Isoptericola aurantiacus]|uniref:signal peptidase II n=1 Tax=Isoptericola aurantiacus TaxID=3377839 RepID=UPI00383BC49D